MPSGSGRTAGSESFEVGTPAVSLENNKAIESYSAQQPGVEMGKKEKMCLALERRRNFLGMSSSLPEVAGPILSTLQNRKKS